MKIIHTIFLITGALLLSVSFVYGKEYDKTQKGIQELSLSSKVIQSDSLTLVAEQEKMMNLLLKRQETFEQKYFILIGIVLLLVVLFGLLCFFNKRGDKRLNKIISLLEKIKTEHTNTITDDNHNNKNTTLDIDPCIIQSIIENLRDFENEQGFLNTKITLFEFAKKLQTNTKYLSKVINTYKLKSFRNYINDLRIQYSIEKLEKKTDFRNYTISAMAKEAGFSNRESFTKAFQKKTGETISEFLKQVS
jgi:AraC-like DNA-binding protein